MTSDETHPLCPKPPPFPLFAREATGLVRSLGLLDQFLVSQGIVAILIGFVLTALFAPYYFPGANLPIVFVLGSIPALAMAVVYGKLSAAIPRSGGDYVWSTRILGPVFGSVQFVLLLLTTVIATTGLAIWSSVTLVLPQLFFSLGADTGNSSMFNIATALGQAPLGYVVSLVIIGAVIVIGLLGLKAYAWFQRVNYIVVYIVLLIFLGVLYTINSSTIPGAFDQAMRVANYNVTYSQILSQASTQGTGFSLSNTLLAAIPWGFLTFTGFNYGAYLAGETRNAKSSMTRALVLSVVVTVIALVLLAVGVYRAFGPDLVNGASTVAAINPTLLPVLPTPNLFLSFVNPNLAIVVGLGIFLSDIGAASAYVVTIARMLFAAAFDRLLPAKFSLVSERFHSPYWATIFFGFLCVVYSTVIWYTNYASTWLNSSLVFPVSYLLPLIAALLFPFVKPSLFKQTLGSRRDVPMIVVAASVGIAAFLAYIFAETFPILSGVFLGASLSVAYGVVAVMVVVGVVLYASAAINLRRFGLDIKRVYAEIPPE